ncbi:Asparagine synthetase [glutamine-hydrolyzing] 3 [Thiorhodovibrio winogradskyi]|uniref:asparagine synthase (glutamine-hydrolyzing) n=1 Tax=Thiorhodovibrio winogradskyi TaxID=77007 RepID=A0ABZ0SAU8_9GAMM|nr:asparagine synthase-related protein [Thiorhodovibrio winogradskyi]
MLHRMLPETDQNFGKVARLQSLEESGGILASTFAWRNPETYHAASEQAKCSIFIHGELYDLKPKLILEDYINQRPAFLNHLEAEGAFAGLIHDRLNSKVHIFADFFGLENIFYYYDNDKFALSTNIKNISAIPGIDRTVDMETLASFWNFGFAINQQTPFKEIKLLPPGTLLSLDLKNWKLAHHTYANLLDLFHFGGDDSQDLAEPVRLFQHAVNIRTSDYASTRLGLSLSGGLDSRAILSAIGEKSAKLTTYTLGLKKCADEILAEKMAAICNTKHTFVPIDQTALEDFESLAQTLVYHSDGFYHPHESTEQVALNYLASDPFDIMLRGHGGEIAKYSLAYPFQSFRGMDDHSSSDIFDHFFERASLARQDIDFKKLFIHPVAQESQFLSYNAMRHSIDPVMKSGIRNCDLGIYLYIDQWIRRQVVSSLSLFRDKVGIRMPYMDRRFIRSLLSLDPKRRYSGEFQRRLVHDLSPDLEKVPDSNTGAPLNAGKVEVFMKDKLHSVLRKMGIKGHRHYTEFQEWQRKHFRDAIQQILFSERCLDRNYYDKKALEGIFQQHISGKNNYSHFFGTAVGIELWHRLFVD